MKVKELATRIVVTADSHQTVERAAKLMRDKHVGDVVVVDEQERSRRPMGIVTDRDIVISVTALGLDASVLTLADIMFPRLYAPKEDEDADAVIQKMKQLGIRRAPVVDADGRLCGIFTMDDYLEYLGKGLGTLKELIKSEKGHEEQSRLTLS